MKAAVITAFGGAETLELLEVEAPSAGPGQVLIDVAAAGLNRADLLQRRGLYPAPPGVPPDIPGLEYAGFVKEAGPGTFLRKVGDRVMGIIGGGAMAGCVVVHERETLAVPPGLTFAEAAAIPEAFLTAFDALSLQCEMTSGDRILIHAVGSGVGTAAIQLAKAAGCLTIGTSRTSSKLEAARALGLDHAILVQENEFSRAVKEAVGEKGVDTILDFVGGPYLKQNLELLNPGGCLILVGLMGGAKAEIPLGEVLTRRLTIRGTTLRARPLEEKIRLARLFERQVMPRFEAGLLRPVIDRVLPMTEIRSAHSLMERNDTFGKIVLTW